MAGGPLEASGGGKLREGGPAEERCGARDRRTS